MQVTDAALFADRIAVAIRWMSLFGFALQLAAGGGITQALNFLMLVSGFWNLSLTGVSIYKKRLPYHEQIVLGIDVSLTGMIFFFSNGPNGVLNWVGLMPVILAALYFGFRGGLYVAAGAIVVQFMLTMIFLSSIVDTLQAMVPVAIIYLVAGIIAGLVSDQIGNELSGKSIIAQVGRPKKGRRVERRRLEVLYRVTSTLNSTLNYERILDMALDLTTEVLADPDDTPARLVSAFMLFETDRMRVGSARRFTNADLRVNLPGNEGLIAQAINSGETKIGVDPIHDPELSRIVAMHVCKSVLCVPLRSGRDVFGVLIFGHNQPGYFGEGRREILEVISQQAQTALVNARLYKDLEEEKTRMTEIQEEARKKLARNLHDGPTQSVAAIAMRVNFARRLIDRDVKGAAEELFKIEDLARRTTKEIRHMLFTLRPLVLESSGLKAALESMADKMKETYEQNVIIEVDPMIVDQIEMGKQGVIFYIVEEAVNNARKHAEAEHILVRLKSGQEDIALLEIIDNGVGFNIGAMESGYEHRGSLGMVNMRERTELISGVLEMESEEGKGTRIRVWIPVTEDAAEKTRHAI